MNTEIIAKKLAKNFIRVCREDLERDNSSRLSSSMYRSGFCFATAIVGLADDGDLIHKTWRMLNKIDELVFQTLYI